jgi:excisionase family DNA binding protein
VAAYLKLADRTVYLYAQTGKIPGIKIGSAWRFRRSEIAQWLDAQQRLTATSTKRPAAPPPAPRKEDIP